ncbi:MAG: tetratricopeptide repeat protein, partial [Planctomycetes bacterium]|nr:tetratricopeptide repeat protein [Planctomycetota bacterium]
ERNDAFIGRDLEMQALRETFREGAQLVTLHGMGGIGKTRLSQEFAKEHFETHKGKLRVHYCELLTARSREELAFLVAAALGIVDHSTGLEERICATLQVRPESFIVLDNAEHLSTEVGELVEKMIRASSKVSILVTSRERLNLGNEVVIPLRPMSSDTPNSDSHRLFYDRARRMIPRYALSAEEVRALDELIRRLDGIPLAIEIVAAQAHDVKPTQMLGRLSQMLSSPGEGSAFRPAHHETMRAAVQWSWDLLSASEQKALAQLSVFSGPFSLEAAEQVLGRDDAADELAIDLLENLIDRSLIQVSFDGARFGEAQYSLLETLKEFASLQLQEFEKQTPKLVEGLHRRHGEFFLGYVIDWGKERQRCESIESFHALSRHRENVMQAIGWGFDQDLHRTARALCVFDQHEFSRGGFSPIGSWLPRAVQELAKGEDLASKEDYVRVALKYCEWLCHDSQPNSALKRLERLRSEIEDVPTEESNRRSWQAQIGALEANALYPLGQTEAGIAACERALSYATDEFERAAALYQQGILYWVLSRTPESLSSFREAEGIYLKANKLFSVAKVRNSIAISLARAGENEEAIKIYQEVRDAALAFGNHRLAATALYNAAGELCTDGRHSLARTYYEDVAAVCLKMGFMNLYAYALGGLGQIYLEQKNFDEAEHHFERCLLVTKTAQATDASRYFSDVLAQVIVDRERGKGKGRASRSALERAQDLLSESENEIRGKASLEIPHFAAGAALCALYAELTRTGQHELREHYRERAHEIAKVMRLTVENLVINLYRDQFVSSTVKEWIDDAESV